MRFKTLPIFLAFFLMGLADAMGPNADKMKDAYQLSNVQSTLVSFSVFIAFAVCSVPGGLMAARMGKKKLLLLGLGLNALALVLPSIQVPAFPVVLGCIFLLGVGTTFLQVAGNPIMRDVSAEGQYSRNLAFAQGIKGIGSAASTWIVTAITTLVLFKSMGWRGAFPLFCILMALAFVAVAFLKVEESKVDEPPSIASSLGLLKHPIFFLAVLGIFLYVGAEASMGRFLKPTLQGFGFKEEAASRYGPTFFFLMLTVGRLLGSATLTIMTPRTCFRLSALVGVLGAAALMSGSEALSVAGVIAAGLGFANIWPMLFSITVEEKPERANELSGLMCMAISGGAIVPLLMAGTLDIYTNQFVPGSTITQTKSGATAQVVNWDKKSSVLEVKGVTGTLDGTNVLTQSGAKSAVATPVAQIWTVKVQSGDFDGGAKLTQANSKAKGTVVSWDKKTNTLVIEPQEGDFNSTDVISQSDPSAASAVPTAPCSYKVVAANGGFAFAVPAICFAYLLLLSLKGSRKPAAVAQPMA